MVSQSTMSMMHMTTAKLLVLAVTGLCLCLTQSVNSLDSIEDQCFCDWYECPALPADCEVGSLAPCDCCDYCKSKEGEDCFSQGDFP